MTVSGYSDMGVKDTAEVKLIRLIADKSAEKNTLIRDLLERESVNWKRFEELVTYHGLAPFFYFSLKDYKASLPGHILEFLKKSYHSSFASSQFIWNEFLRIYGAFEKAQVRILPLKGVSFLCDIYKEIQARPMADIDLLLREEDFPRAEEIFYALGYRKELYGLKEEYYREKQYHISFYPVEKRIKSAILVELHWSLDYKRGGRSLYPELWEKIRPIVSGRRKINVLSPEDAFLSLTLHNRRFGITLSLKNVFDAVMLLDKYSDSFDWGYCLGIMKKYGLRSTVFFMLCQMRLLSDKNIPRSFHAAIGLSRRKRRLIKNFIERNTFPDSEETDTKRLYLKSHFLLYDSIKEPIDYILKIPQEQFASYYDLEPYDKKTEIFYKSRIIYTLFNLIKDQISKIARC